MLKNLLTAQGEKPLYEAVSQCSRCGYCEQACPTYVATGREGFSARGRNQLVRLLAEKKLSDPRSALEALSTCLLCGACSTACPASVPTADIVLEGRRMLRGEPHPLLRKLTGLPSERPEAFSALLRWAYRFKRWGLAGLAVRTRVLRLLGLGSLQEAAAHVDEAPERFLREELGQDPRFREPAQAAWLYFAACGTDYVFPRVGRATLKVLEGTLGGGCLSGNACCGLIAYNYGSLEDARSAARANIERLERSGSPEAAPLVCDCSSCAAHLKGYPQLFLEDPDWRKRAEAFSARVKDAAELPFPPAGGGPEPVTYHDSCRAVNGQGIRKVPRESFRNCAGFREMAGADVCCGGAGAFAFTQPALSEDLLRKKTANIAASHARTVVATSTSCLIQLARGLKKYYPECRVVHLSEWRAERLPHSNER